MTKQELLTKLAIECATWGEAQELSSKIGYDLRFLSGRSQIFKQDWLAERYCLLNKPNWNDAPDGATHMAMDANGVHWFYNASPYPSTKSWKIDGIGNYGWEAGSTIAIPAGYDWKSSLEERPK